MSEIPYSIITTTGVDAFDFLQAQLTVDLAELSRQSEAKPLRSAWCNPKGRVICMPELSLVDDAIELALPGDLADIVLQRLSMFRFRAKVEFALQDAAPRTDELRLENLRAGIAEIRQTQSEEYTPHMLNLDLLNIVSLDKGCYPGQEIVARTHYRGKSKRRLFRFESSEPVAAGDKVSNGEREIGEVVNAIGTDLLAVVPIDSTSDSLTVGNSKLALLELPYSI